jgi:hypothetical protein
VQRRFRGSDANIIVRRFTKSASSHQARETNGPKGISTAITQAQKSFNYRDAVPPGTCQCIILGGFSIQHDRVEFGD